MPTVYINGQAHKLTAKAVIGSGGEAHVYDLKNGQALKLFKQSNDPDYQQNPTAQKGAVQRLLEHQTKLPAFPKGLPKNVIAPIALARSAASGGEVVGYTMPYLAAAEVLLSFGKRSYRENGGIDGNRMVEILRKLHQTVTGVHQQHVVIGDFNDLNVLVDPNDDVYMIDADSMQYGQFYCNTFTQRFLDPSIATPTLDGLLTPFSADSDWYAFAVMVMQSCLYTSPYGGVYRTSSGTKLPETQRMLQRATVFDSNVLYPKPAVPYDRLPEELVDYFQRTFTKDERGVFPFKLLANLRWTTCTSCGEVHAKPRCPQCAAPGVVKQTTVIRGTVTATRLFTTRGRLLLAAHQGGKLRYLYHEQGAFFREGQQHVIDGELDPEFRYRLQGNTTLLGKSNQLVAISPSGTDVQRVDTAGRLPVFDANSSEVFRLDGGRLLKKAQIGDDYIGDMLEERSLIWVGERFGFGLSLAGSFQRSYVFNTEGGKLNDQVRLPHLPGQVIDATVCFADDIAWFMVSLQDAGKLKNYCYVVDKTGAIVGEETAETGEDSWLGNGIRGRYAVGRSLFAATDNGIVRVSCDSGVVNVSQTFPDTADFVANDSQLLGGDGGIYVINRNEIYRLTIK